MFRTAVECRNVKLFACLGGVLWFATWSRCEGLILWIAAFAVLISLVAFRQITLAFASKSLLALLLVFALGVVMILHITTIYLMKSVIFR